MTRKIENIKDENGVLHVCKNCNFVLYAGNKKDRILVSKIYRVPPKSANLVVCDDCL